MKAAIFAILILLSSFIFADDIEFSKTSGTPTIAGGSVDATLMNLADGYDWTGLHTFADLAKLNGGSTASINSVTGTDSLTSADCGRITTVTAGIDTHTITLPEASTVIGCKFKIVYVGASGGALVDISPLDSDADGIIGSCTLAASVVSFSGTADADIGLTKATSLIGDWIELTAVSASQYAVTGCQGIWANN